MKKVENKQEIFCTICGSLKDNGSKFCNHCQKETPNKFRVSHIETHKIRSAIKEKQKRPGFKGFLNKSFSGYKPSKDPKLSEGVDEQMTIDREKNEYHQVVRNNLTGEIMHEEHIPLDQHKSKNKKKQMKIKKSQNLPKEWRKVKLGKVLEFKYGFSLPEKIRANGDVPVFGSSGIIGSHDESAVKSQGIILGRKGHVGNVYYSSKPFYPIDTVYYIDQLKIPGDLKFFYYFLQKIQFQKIGSDVGVPGLNRDIAYGLEIIIPKNPATQKCIASILSAFDEKIELNNKMNQTLEEMAQAIFKEWCLKNQKSKIKNQKLGDLVEIISGYPFSSKLYTKNKKALGVVTIKNVQDGNFIPTCNSFISGENIPKNMNPECHIKDGDILLSLTGNVGRVCFVYGGEYLLNQRVAKLKPKQENNRAFCYFLFRQPTLQNQLINMTKGSAQPNLSPVETGEIVLDIPSREILDEFNKILNPIYNRLIQNMVENQKLAKLRDLLLPKLMSGEIRI